MSKFAFYRLHKKSKKNRTASKNDWMFMSKFSLYSEADKKTSPAIMWEKNRCSDPSKGGVISSYVVFKFFPLF